MAASDHLSRPQFSVVDLYHHTTPEAAQSIVRDKVFDTSDGRNFDDEDDFDERAYFSDRKNGEARRYGPAAVHFRVPEHELETDDTFDTGETHYSMPVDRIRSRHIIGIA